MTARDRHMKASDVFAQSDFMFARKTSDFSEAFPTIQELSVVVEEVGDGVRERNSKRHLSERNLGEYIDCRNPRCFSGGFSIGSILRRMVSSHETQGDFHEFCEGYEGSPKGRRNDGPCDTEFHVTVHIVYREDA